MSPKELETKIKNISDKNKGLKTLNRAYRKRLQELSESRDLWKAKYFGEKEKRCGRSGGPAVSPPCPPGRRIARHKYCEWMVSLCLNIYMLGNCSLRSCIRILSCLPGAAGIAASGLPCKSSVSNWIKKAGYRALGAPGGGASKDGYALIMDECMVMGQERMLCCLAVPAGKTGCAPLRQSSVAVAALKVRPSWNGDRIGDLLKKVGEEMGGPPAYIVSDGGANLLAGIGKSGAPRICDVAHESGRLMERLYGRDARYLAFSKAMTLCRHREVMKETAFLMPPVQRSIARFMNLSPCLTWAGKMAGLLAGPAGGLPEAGREAFAWVSEHAEIIKEMGCVINLSDKVCGILKSNGLSKKSVSECRGLCAGFGKQNGTVAAIWAEKLGAYLLADGAKLPEGACWHASSDIIESMFGSFKARKADNPLHGVTSFALILPLLTRISGQGAIDMDIKGAMESVLLSDIKAWETENLVENQVVRRNKAFKK